MDGQIILASRSSSKVTMATKNHPQNHQFTRLHRACKTGRSRFKLNYNEDPSYGIGTTTISQTTNMIKKYANGKKKSFIFHVNRVNKIKSPNYLVPLSPRFTTHDQAIIREED